MLISICFAFKGKFKSFREIFHRVPSVKKILWGGEFWSDGYFVNTVGKHTNEAIISATVRNQGTESDYKQLHSGQMKSYNFEQSTLF